MWWMVVVTLLSGCVRGQVEEPLAWRVFVPAVAHDCTPIICGEVERLNALIECRQEMVRLRVEENRVQMPEDCAEFMLPEDAGFGEALK